MDIFLRYFYGAVLISRITGHARSFVRSSVRQSVRLSRTGSQLENSRTKRRRKSKIGTKVHEVRSDWCDNI